MKSKIFVILCSLMIDCSFGQDLNTLMKLHDYSVSFGCTSNPSVDTLVVKARIGKMNIKLSEQLIYLLRAAESYSIKDYENSRNYVQKVGMFRYPEYDNLKFFLIIGNYSNLKDTENAAKYFYVLNKYTYVDPNNLKSISREIRSNFKRNDFDYALSYYYYYHKRLNILDEIGFAE